MTGLAWNVVIYYNNLVVLVYYQTNECNIHKQWIKPTTIPSVRLCHLLKQLV